MYFFCLNLRKAGENMENIEKTQQYGTYIDDMTLNNSTVAIGKDPTLRLYKSRSGAAAKDKPRRLWISKTRYYNTKELNAVEIEKVRSFIGDMRSYKAKKAAGVKGLKRPQEPRFAHVKPHKIEPKPTYKDKGKWDNIARNFENVVINTFNCSGNKVFGEYYITLTQADGRIRGEQVANAQYNAFLKSFRRWISSKKTKGGKPFKYSMLTVKEYGAQGYHYHILLKILLDWQTLYNFIDKVWKHGKVYVESLTNALGLSRYFFGASNERVSLIGDQALIKEKIKEKESEIKDFIRLAKAANKKDLKELEQSYLDGAKYVKEDLKQLRRSVTKRDDTVMRTSGDISKTLRITTQDRFFWQYIRKHAKYIYSERVQVQDVTETGEKIILNEVFSDFYKLEQGQAAYLYQYVLKLLDQGRAVRK